MWPLFRKGDRVEALRDVYAYSPQLRASVKVADKGAKGTVTTSKKYWEMKIVFDHTGAERHPLYWWRDFTLLCPKDYAFRRERFGLTDACQGCEMKEACQGGAS